MTEQPKKFEPETFTLFTHDKPRAAEIDRLKMFCEDLPLDKHFHVKVKQGEEDRSVVANRLYQSIIGQVCKQMEQRSDNDIDRDPSVVAGKLKKHLLLPLKAVMAAEFGDDDLMAEYQFERSLCDMIASSELIGLDDLYPAYDRAIRSKTLKVKAFARYLDRVIDKLTMQGFVIRLKATEKARAIGDQSTEAKAA